MHITPRVTHTIKTVFFHAIKNDGTRTCRLCKRDIAVRLADYGDYEAPEPWRPGCSGEARPWEHVAEAWFRAGGHHPDCPLKALGDLVLALEELHAEEAPLRGTLRDPVPAGAPSSGLDARTMARVAMHFIGYLDRHGATIKTGDDDLSWDKTVFDYEDVLGGTPDAASLDDGDFYDAEFLAGRSYRPLPPDKE
jgi:hypothetical protein